MKGSTLLGFLALGLIALVLYSLGLIRLPALSQLAAPGGITIYQQQDASQVQQPAPAVEIPDVAATIQAAVDANTPAGPAPTPLPQYQQASQAAPAPTADPATWAEQPALDSADGLTNSQLQDYGIVPGTGGANLTPGHRANCAYLQSSGQRVSPQCPADAAQQLGQGR